MTSPIIYLIYILLIIKSAYSIQKFATVFKKCCATDEVLIKEILNNFVTYSCSDQFSNNITPLQIHNKAKIEVSLPDYCQDNEICVDKTDNNNIIQLSCESKAKIITSTFTKIYKCCPKDMSYNSVLKSCTFLDTNSSLQLLEDEEAEIYDIQIGQPKCNNAFVDYPIVGEIQIRNGALSMKDKTKVVNGHKVLKTGSYCVDNIGEENQIVRICEDARNICEKMACIPKCCEHGNMYLTGKRDPECRPVWNESFVPEPTGSENEIIDLKGNFAVRPPISCSYKRYLLNMSVAQFYPNGTLRIAGRNYDSFDNKYCLENVQHGDNSGLKILVCFPPPITPTYLYYFSCLVISCIFLTATLIVYFLLPELQNLHGKTVMCHAASLLAMYMCLSGLRLKPTDLLTTPCTVLGFYLMFWFISAFAWLNVMCFDIWWTFGVINVSGTKKKKERKTFSLYCLYAFGVAALVTSFTAFAMFYDGFPHDYKPTIGQKTCYFHTPNIVVYTIYLLGPIAILNFSNIIFFVLTAKTCIKVKMNIARMRDSATTRKQTFLADKETLLMNVKLFVVMGISWTIEILGNYIEEPKTLWMILDSLNTLQGLWIFCIFVLKQKVWKALKHRCGYQLVKETSQTQTSMVSSKNSYASLANYRTNSIPEDSSILKNVLNEKTAARNII